MLIRWLVGMCDRLCAVAGAFIFSQVPLFYQQYSQRLAGHVAEAERHVRSIQEAAALSGKSLTAYIEKFTSQIDPDFSAQGMVMQNLTVRLSSLQEAYGALIQAAPWWKPYYFAKYLHADIADAALRDFSPGLALNTESALYALLGMITGYSAFQIIRWVLRGIFKLWRLRPRPSAIE